MAGEILYDPASGRPYRFNPATGHSEWIDDPPAQPTLGRHRLLGRFVVIKDARTFGDAFDANQVAAERQWKGKRVQLTAEVANITERAVTFTSVTTEKFSLTQVAYRLSDPEQALTLKNGEQATAVGTVVDQSMGVIQLKDCVLK